MDNNILRFLQEEHSDYETPLYLTERMKDRDAPYHDEGCYPFEDNSYEYSENPLTDEEIDAWEDEQYKKRLNISRDEKGRLHKGSTIAKKRRCDEDEIWLLYSQQKCTVKEIVDLRGCSKSTVYNVIKKYKEKGM